MGKQKRSLRKIFNAISCPWESIRVEKIIENLPEIINLNQFHAGGKTALTLAVKQYDDDTNAKVIDLLVKKGANIDLCDIKGNTPLFYALKRSYNVKTVLAIIEGGANVNLCNPDGILPLFYALEHHLDVAIIKAIINHGVDLNALNSKGQTALEVVLDSYGGINFEIVDAIFDKMPVDMLVHTIFDAVIKHDIGDSRTAYNINYPELLLMLLDRGFDIETINKDRIDRKNRSLFVQALKQHIKSAHCDNMDGLNELLKRGADINAEDEEGISVFWILLDEILKKNYKKRYDATSILNFYIECGANLNFVNKVNGKSVLMKLLYLSHSKNMELVEKLLKEKAFENVEHHSKKNYTALHYALLNTRNSIPLIKIILEQNSSLTKKIDVKFLLEMLKSPIYHDYEGEVSIKRYYRNQLKAKNHNEYLCNKIMLVLSCDMDIIRKGVLEPLLIQLVKKSRNDVFLPVLSVLLREEVNVNYCDENGVSSLMFALEKYDEDYKYRNIEEKNQKENYRTIRLLLNHNASYRECNGEQSRPFITYIDYTNASYDFIWKIIQQKEYQKYNMNHSILPFIKNYYQRFTLNPDSLVAQLTSIKWQLQQKSPGEVYKEVNKSLMQYFGIGDADSMVWKAEDQLAHLE